MIAIISEGQTNTAAIPYYSMVHKDDLVCNGSEILIPVLQRLKICWVIVGRREFGLLFFKEGETLGRRRKFQENVAQLL